jgi:CHAT domain-containing protein/tetratricopeptide (TPR) repeat protein
MRTGAWRVVVAALVATAALGVARAQDADHTEMDRLLVAQRYNEAQQLAERRYNAARAAGDGGGTADWGLSLARADVGMGRFDRAEGLFRQGIAFFRNKVGSEHMVTGMALVDLGAMFWKQGRLDDAEPPLRQGLGVVERTAGHYHLNTGHAYSTLANCLSHRGRFREAEGLIKQAIDIERRVLGPGHVNTLTDLLNLAVMYSLQSRRAEEEAIYRELIPVARQALGPDAPILVTAYSNLGGIANKAGRLDEAESLFKQALAIVQKNYGPEHPEAAGLYGRLGLVVHQRGRLEEAQPLFQKCLALLEKAYGPESPELAHWLIVQSTLHAARDNLGDAVAALDRCVALLEKAGANPEKRFQAYVNRALYAFAAGRRDAAVFDDVKKAMALAEAQRGLVSGAARERSTYFASFAMAFELMVAFQLELGDKGDPAEAFAAMERFHARSLLDEMQAAGTDPDLGRPPGEREALRRREAELHRRVADLEARLAAEKDRARAAALGVDLARARDDLYRHYRDATETSPVYRSVVSRTGKLPTLADVQRRLRPGDLLLEFLVGDVGGDVMAVTHDSALIQSFGFNDDEARVMGVAAGNLTDALMRQAFLNDKGTGLIQQLANPKVPAPVDQLKVMWNTVAASPLHTGLSDGSIKRLIVIPDGPLGLFPFETLVTGDGPNGPVYLLDSGPPIVYAPSAAVFLSLAEKPAAAPPAGREPVLALGDPAYPAAGAGAGAGTDDSARSRFSMAGGRLARLPHSGTEAQWVAQVFRDAGTPSVLLKGTAATESGVRNAAPGRRVLHLACHGLADEERGNFFASLALTPGPGAGADPADDGFLTLKEIHGLDLRGCELAILSACETNFGPQQMGEGTLALSRGFLVAGARRVVASNWLVDDEAAATLVSVFCSGLAKGGAAPDYARSLQAAKRWVRRQPKWRSPYYWASLEMLGPP